MTREWQELDCKSLRYAMGKHRDADALACDCVGFANATGGVILLGIEDGGNEPPAGQQVPEDVLEALRRRIPQITVNVACTVQRQTSANGGEYAEILVAGNRQSVASTSDGRYFLRVSDATRRLLPDDLSRLVAERNTFVWELQTTRQIAFRRHDPDKLAAFVNQIGGSDRVSDFVKNKSEEELLEHYLFVKDGWLTNLGVLWIGRREDRAELLYSPIIQCIKYDEQGRKVRKQVWDDFHRNPIELISAVWQEVPDWRESYELPAGLFRKTVPHYEEVVVRELLANALVHRPYTQRGDIFINLHPDRMEVHNPGLLPIGVTPENILHTSVKRNQHLAKVFYDLKLMEGEGSGFDRMYESLLSSGRPAPQVKEGDDRVAVTVWKRIAKPEIVDLMARVDRTLQPTQKELITLGLIAQQEAVTAMHLERLLDIRGADELRHWIGRLRTWRIVNTRGKTKATEYFVDPNVLRRLEFKGTTSLRGIETHRLRELVLRDLEIYQQASISQIHQRIGPEIPRRKLQHELRRLVEDGQVGRKGARRHTIYLWTR